MRADTRSLSAISCRRQSEQWLCCALLAAWFVMSPRTASAQAIKLADLEAHALRGRPLLAAASARVAEAKAGVTAAKSAYSPALNLLGDLGIAPGGQKITDIWVTPPGRDAYQIKVAELYPIEKLGAFSPIPRWGVTLDARGTLYDFGRTSAAVDAAVAQRRAAEADVHKAQQDVARDVRAAYVQWATAHALWSISERAAKAAEERRRQAEAAIEEGARRLADRTAADSDAGFARLELARARADLDNARRTVSFIAALELTDAAYPADGIAQLSAASAATEASAARGDPALTALQQQQAAARASARVHDHAFTPVLSANAQAGVQGQFGGVFPLYRVGVNMTVPLWDGHADRAERSQAEARAAEVAAQTAEYVQQREHLRRRALFLEAQARERVALAQELVRVCGQRLAQLEEARPLGGASSGDVADARAAVQRAETELVMAHASRARASLGLE